MVSQEEIWDALLKLRRFQSDERQVIGWSFCEHGFTCHHSMTSLLTCNPKALLVRSSIVVQCMGKGWNSIILPFEDLKLLYKSSLSKEVVDMLKLYSPLSVMHFYKREKPFVIVHVAASLDGKMATHLGDSKWIGNQENLIHSHRLRALVDGILVGAQTVKNDKPSLNVRHVKGENPTRLVISNHSKDFSGLREIEGTKTFLVREECYKKEDKYDCFDEVIYFAGGSEAKKVDGLLQGLYDKGIETILIEGGSETISSVFNSGEVDVFQVHYAPIILGSGKGIVDLPLIDKISDASALKHSFWTQVGDSFMVTAAL